MKTSIRPLLESDLPETDRIFRLAFGTFLGLPDPMDFAAGCDYVQTRWRGNPEAAFVAEVDGELVGSNFAADWGSFGIFGPLTIRPDHWNHGVGKLLVQAAIDQFNRWGISQSGLFTFPHSPKHLGLYQSFDFWPGSLTALLSKEITKEMKGDATPPATLSAESDRESLLEACAQLTDSLLPGLDLRKEILSVASQSLGDTILIHDDTGLAGFAICHTGHGAEAGPDKCYVKFGAVRPGKGADIRYSALLDACEAFTVSCGLKSLDAGVNTSRLGAYQHMLKRGFRAGFIGIAMHRGSANFNRPDVYVMDDWR